MTLLSLTASLSLSRRSAPQQGSQMLALSQLSFCRSVKILLVIKAETWALLQATFTANQEHNLKLSKGWGCDKGRTPS